MRNPDKGGKFAVSEQCVWKGAVQVLQKPGNKILLAMQSNHFEFDLSQTFFSSTKFRSSRILCLNTIVHHIFIHMKYSDILSLPLFAQSGTIERTFLYFASQPHTTQIIIHERTLKVPDFDLQFHFGGDVTQFGTVHQLPIYYR